MSAARHKPLAVTLCIVTGPEQAKYPPFGTLRTMTARLVADIRTGCSGRVGTRFKPATISRRFSVAAGFYRTCVIDAVLEHSPAEHARRPNVPAESPTLGFTHLHFEALLTAARESANDYDFALVAMLGLLGLRIFEATGASFADLGEEHGHRVLRVCSKGTKAVLVPLHGLSAGQFETGSVCRGERGACHCF